MKILFVYSNRVRDLLPAPPVGLSYVASATADAGHQVRFVDLLQSARDRDRLRRALRRFRPDVVGISVRNIDNVIHQRLVRHLGELARQVAVVREECEARVVIGGPAIGILGCRVLELIDADFALPGEGEQAFPALLEEMARGGDFSKVTGVCSRSEDRTLVTAAPQRLSGFGASGMERWVDWRRYERQGATWPIQCKRGCPLQCTYCTYPAIEGRALRKRDPSEVLDEMIRVGRSAGPRCFEFVDSVFNFPEGYAVELCEEIIRSGERFRLTTMGVNPRFLSRELLTLMKRAGFNSLMVTPESASDPVLTRMRKGFSKDDVLRGAELIRESGIPSMWFFMLGALGETEETAEETVSFVERNLNWENCLPMFTTGIRILPGTELARQARDQGYIAADRDLAESVFFFSPQVSEAWLLRRVDRAIAVCPRVVHAAEDPSATRVGIWSHRLLYLLGAAPPYWRFYPRLLSFPFVHRARTKA